MLQYYIKTNKASVDEMIKDLKENGFEVSLSLSKFQITRKTSEYNKYMKWYLEETYENGAKSSQYFKTQKAAYEYINKSRQPLPSGLGMVMTYSQEI